MTYIIFTMIILCLSELYSEYTLKEAILSTPAPLPVALTQAMHFTVLRQEFVDSIPIQTKILL